MQLETHLAIGWLMGNLVPGGDRRLRGLVCFSALAPDLDGVSYVLGPDAYSNSHHVYGHNVFAGIAFTFVCFALSRPGWRLVTTALAAAGCASHWVGDYYLSGWPLMTFWPVSRHEVMYRPRIGLDHPINQVLSIASILFFIVGAFVWKRTIFEFVWPAMDRLLVGLTLPRTDRCAVCERPTAQHCIRCGNALCLRHARLTGGMRVTCAACPGLPVTVGGTERTP